MRWRDRLPVLAGTAAGLAAAFVVTLLQASTYRAEASIALVRQGRPPGDDPALAQAAKAAAELFHSRAVAEPAIANLRLDESPEALLDRVSIDTAAESSLLRVSVEAPTPDEARRTVQELVELATVLFNDRFGPETSATVWETPRAQEDRVSPRPAWNLALGLLLGAIAGSAFQLRRRPKRLPKPSAPAPASVQEAVAEPRPAAAAPIPAPEPEPVPGPVPEPEPDGPFVLPALGAWRLQDVERLLAEQGAAFPDRIEELRWYLASFRDVAGPGGTLPGGVEAVMEDVFRDLIDRARSAPAS
jgi:capsular polysaccharide biosynthesis protein